MSALRILQLYQAEVDSYEVSPYFPYEFFNGFIYSKSDVPESKFISLTRVGLQELIRGPLHTEMNYAKQPHSTYIHSAAEYATTTFKAVCD